MLGHARRAFELESDRQSPWRATVHVLLGFAMVRAGLFEDAREFLETGTRLARQDRLWMDAVGAETLLSRIELEGLNTPMAERHARDAVELASSHALAGGPTGAYASVALGSAHVRAGRPAEGERLLAAAMPPIRTMGEPLLIAESLIAHAEAYRALGRRANAVALEREAEALVDAMPDPGVLRQRLRRQRRTKPAAPAAALSPRELDVLMLMSRGLSNRQVASALYVSYNTVHSHVRAIYRKLNVQSRTQAAARARDDGLINTRAGQS
jgi:LuxR family maltose regulon positive regulatory protein